MNKCKTMFNHLIMIFITILILLSFFITYYKKHNAITFFVKNSMALDDFLGGCDKSYIKCFILIMLLLPMYMVMRSSLDGCLLMCSLK